MIQTASISELKQAPAKVLQVLKETNQPTYIIQHSEVAAVLVSPAYFEEIERLQARIEEMEDLKIIKDRAEEKSIPYSDYRKKRS
jgi:PHD/YefM family antitoxin component YafN of YafNO toxin-antitoxin module